MSQRAAELADAFEAVHIQVVRAVTQASPEQWTTTMPDEQWPTGFGFYHLAEGYELIRGWIEKGQPGKGQSFSTRLPMTPGMPSAWRRIARLPGTKYWRY